MRVTSDMTDDYIRVVIRLLVFSIAHGKVNETSGDRDPHVPPLSREREPSWNSLRLLNASLRMTHSRSAAWASSRMESRTYSGSLGKTCATDSIWPSSSLAPSQCPAASSGDKECSDVTLECC